MSTETRNNVDETRAPEPSRASNPCSRCGTVNKPEDTRCKNPKCRGMLRGNTLAMTHGAVLLERRGAAMLTEEIRAQASEFYEQGLRDLGGEENLSAIERGQLQNLVRLYTEIRLYDNYLTEAGPLTKRGRLRSCVQAFHAALALYNQLGKTLGFARRPKLTKRTIEDFLSEQPEPETGAPAEPDHAE